MKKNDVGQSSTAKKQGHQLLLQEIIVSQCSELTLNTLVSVLI